MWDNPDLNMKNGKFCQHLNIYNERPTGFRRERDWGKRNFRTLLRAA
jgi:hypothetical protein